MDLLDDLDLDTEDVTEAIVLVLIVVLVVVFVVMLCYQLKKRTDERRKRERLVEEAGSFFSFHEALPHTVPNKPVPLASLCKTSVFALSGDQTYPGLPYTTVAQTEVQSGPGCGAVGQSPVLLGQGQHVSTPIYPPSYFLPSSPAPSVIAPHPNPSTPPPPYLLK